MYLNQRIAAIAQLGQSLGHLSHQNSWPGYDSGLSEDEFNQFKGLIQTQHQYNGWFTEGNVKKALKEWSAALTLDNLDRWISKYDLVEQKSAKKVGIICAGNLPLVGFHDVLTVLVSGHKAIIKLSSDDNKLIPAIMQLLVKFYPEFQDQFEFVEQRMNGMEAVIATGSNNTSRYFEYYFRDVPHIIRKSRTSIAVLDGSETEEQLQLLGNDIFDYFGLGCRSVSKVYVPEHYDLNRIFKAIYEFHPIVNHHKYANNYDYNKAVWMLNGDNLLDNGFILFKEETRIASPTASLYYEYYKDRNVLNEFLGTRQDELQCIVGNSNVPFGESQRPMLWEYADGVDTVKFLQAL